MPWRASNERTWQFSSSSLSHRSGPSWTRTSAFSAYIDFPCEQCEIKTSILFQWPFTSQIPNTCWDHSKESMESIELHCFLCGAVCQSAWDIGTKDFQNKMVSFSSVNAGLAKQENTTWTWISRCVYFLCQNSILPDALSPTSPQRTRTSAIFGCFSSSQKQNTVTTRDHLHLISKGNEGISWHITHF